MTDSIWIYSIKINLSISILYLIYVVFFSRTTFHKLNRFVLLFSLFFSICSPFLAYNFIPSDGYSIHVEDWLLDQEEMFVDWQTDQGEAALVTVNSKLPIFPLTLVYTLIVGLLFFRFIRQIYGIVRLKQKAIKIDCSEEPCYVVNHRDAPFSFFNWIFLSKIPESRPKQQYIIKHEKAHARQLHTLDLLVCELYCIIFWFNPFVFFIKRSLKTVHEYLADEDAARVNAEKKAYLQLLLECVTTSSSVGMSSNFYWLTIKKRIKMITKNKTPRTKKMAYLLLVPALAMIIQSFSGFQGERTPGNSLADKSNIPSISPIQSELVRKTSGFGMRIHPIDKTEKMHNGIDLSAPEGTPVVSTADGRVVKTEFIEENKGYGRLLVIQHDETYSTMYAQLSAFKVKTGDVVKKGQVVGLVGSSGISTGSHLHYMLIKNGEKVDPEPYMGINF